MVGAREIEITYRARNWFRSELFIMLPLHAQSRFLRIQFAKFAEEIARPIEGSLGSPYRELIIAIGDRVAAFRFDKYLRPFL